MPSTPAWLASAEAVLNRNIEASSEAKALAKRLDGSSLQVNIDGVTRVRAACLGGRLSLLAAEDDSLPADAVISGSPPALLQMFKAATPSAQTRSSVQIRGDAEIANLYRELFAAARPDLEEELSRWIGDLPARHLSQLALSVRTWARRARRTAGENIAEYLQEEGRDLVTKTEVEEFLRGVDGVRDGVDRIEARLKGLEQRLSPESVGEDNLMRLRVLARLLQIQRALVRHRLDEFVRATHLYRPLRYLFYLSPWTWFQRSINGTRGERLRLALEDLGPIFVKFGQALSTRRDLLPVDIADELAKLQDRVPPFPGSVAIAMIEKTFGQPIGEIFGSFESAPLAAASIAQVHAATLKSGEEVVVKVLRPGMREIIELDLEVLDALAGLADEYWIEARPVRPVEVVREYRKTVTDELDLMREAGNAAQLKRNFAGSSLLYVPNIYWDLCRQNVMVMERIHGIIVSQVDELRARGANIAKLAENGVEIFFTQVFRHNFFHADMHPGNIFVQVDDPENPRYAAIDFGIVGTLQPRDQHYLAENFMAFFNRDYGRIAQLHIESGWVPKGTRVDELESAVRTVCEPIYNKPLKEISFAQVLLRLFETARRFDMQVQPQLILLQKTLFNIEGLGRQLYPELDLWKTAQPVLRDWMQERTSPRTILREIRKHWPDALLTLRQIPGVLQTAVREASEGNMPTIDRQVARLRANLLSAAARRDTAIAAAVLWLSGLVWLAVSAQYPWFGGLQMLAAIVLYVRLKLRRPRPE